MISAKAPVQPDQDARRALYLVRFTGQRPEHTLLRRERTWQPRHICDPADRVRVAINQELRLDGTDGLCWLDIAHAGRELAYLVQDHQRQPIADIGQCLGLMSAQALRSLMGRVLSNREPPDHLQIALIEPPARNRGTGVVFDSGMETSRPAEHARIDLHARLRYAASQRRHEDLISVVLCEDAVRHLLESHADGESRVACLSASGFMSVAGYEVLVDQLKQWFRTADPGAELVLRKNGREAYRALSRS
jgi:hypothetical protein